MHRQLAGGKDMNKMREFCEDLFFKHRYNEDIGMEERDGIRTELIVIATAILIILAVALLQF